MSKLRPTQSMWVVLVHVWPVCSLYGWPKAMWMPGSFSSCRMFPMMCLQATLVPIANSPTRSLFSSLRV